MGTDGLSETKKFGQDEVIFRENDDAASLYIIKKGQIRLYRPKGKGFIEIGILRSGEVLGEMAYFDKSSPKRSCSASAMISTEVFEIPFSVLDTLMKSVNPSFKTLIYTMAERLRKTNERVKGLEFNSLGYGQDGGYKFFSNIDIIRIFVVTYFTSQATSRQEEDGTILISFNPLNYNLSEIFNVPEVKVDAFFQLLESEKHIEVVRDKEGVCQFVKILDIEEFKNIKDFFNIRRKLKSAQQIKLSSKSVSFFKAIIKAIGETEEKEVTVELDPIIKEFQVIGTKMSGDDLREAIDAKMCRNITINEGKKLSCTVDMEVVRKIFSGVKLLTLIEETNAARAANS